LQLGNFKRSNAGDAALFYVKSTHATVGRWPDALAVPDDATDALARVAVHIDAGLGPSLLAVMPNHGGVPFGVPAGALTAAGCPAPLAAATALWSFAMTNAARPLISRANAVSARREHVDEIDLMAAARGQAHLEFGLSAAGGPAIAAAVWCAPVELSELWHLSPMLWSLNAARPGRDSWPNGGRRLTGWRGTQRHGRGTRGQRARAGCAPRRRLGTLAGLRLWPDRRQSCEGVSVSFGSGSQATEIQLSTAMKTIGCRPCPA
jgi:hypothetical protein